MTDERRVVLQGQVLPAEHRAEVAVPAGTLLGLSVFARMKFTAARRMLEAQEQALRAKTGVHDAETGVAEALVRREIVREQIRNIHLITGDERNRLQHLYDARLRVEEAAVDEAAIEAMRRQLRKLEIEAQMDAVRAQRARMGQPAPPPPAPPSPPEKFADILHAISRIPNLAKRAAEAKDQIIREAGGEDKLTEAHIDLMAVIDAMVQGSISKDAESTVL
jgi:hypothetical protein